MKPDRRDLPGMPTAATGPALTKPPSAVSAGESSQRKIQAIRANTTGADSLWWCLTDGKHTGNSPDITVTGTQDPPSADTAARTTPGTQKNDTGQAVPRQQHKNPPGIHPRSRLRVEKVKIRGDEP